MYKRHYFLLQCIDDLLKKSGKKAPADHAAVWIPDAETNTCMHCKKVQFTLVNRRHHCRSEPVLQIYLLGLCLIRYVLASADLFYLRFFFIPRGFRYDFTVSKAASCKHFQCQNRHFRVFEASY
jgi:hypothetical protein